MPNKNFDISLIFGRKSVGNLSIWVEQFFLSVLFFHSNAHIFEFPTNYQHKTQISAGHSEQKIN